MTKIYGLFGSMTGKLADTVMSVRNGVQIARKYQPVVYNPSTPAQIAQRAKMKLMSQLSAIMAPVIAMPRVGSMSARNRFVKKNFLASTFGDDKADINLTDVQLTDSVVGFPAVTYASRTANSLQVALAGATATQLQGISRVIYAVFARQADDKLRFVNSISATGSFQETLDVPADALVIYAYGVRDNNEAARVIFENLEVVDAGTVASLIASRTLTEADVTLTETTSVAVPAYQGE